MQETANTFGYMVLGYGVILATMGLYLLSLYIRTRNLKRDMELLEDVWKD